jgi:hypothetical protein
MIYILVTLVFSTIIWKATQAGAKAAKAATEASNASLEMARDLKKRQEEEEQLKPNTDMMYLLNH